MNKRGSFPAFVTVLFGGTMLASAALMFWVQPMLGKALLPRTGGVPSAWLVAMAFFQLCLLAGYILAHSAARLKARQHALLWLGLLVGAAFFLPPRLGGTLEASSDAIAWQVFKALALGVGFPFVALSMTSSTLQRLYATTKEGARNPYVLFAASNFGSFLGLLAYPAIIEPWTGLSRQTLIWSCIYTIVGMGGLLALLMARRQEEAPTRKADEPLTGRARLKWVLYASVACSLSMGFTDHVTTDIASAPLLWVLPLAIYLLTFVEAFADKPRFRAETIEKAFLLCAAPKIVIDLFGQSLPPGLMFAFALLTFSLGALALHKRLAAERPSASRLTEYYVFVALGGAIGGCFNAFLAPILFVKPVEFALASLIGILLLRKPRADGKGQFHGALLALAGLLLMLGLMLAQTQVPSGKEELLVPFMLISLVALAWGLLRAVHLAVLVPLFAVLLMTDYSFVPQRTQILERSRNFFGSVMVTESNQTGEKIRQLRHGTTLHGEQLQAPEFSREALTYYGSLSPVRDAIRTAPEGARMVFVGLGAGSMACLVPTGASAVFIEIDPQVVHFAEKYFTFLSQCPPEKIEVTDGRLGLAAMPDGQADLLAIDAFSSDSVPAHMLTVEAMKLYAQKLKPDGILILHLSNRYLRLEPIVAAALKEAGLQATWRSQTHKDSRNTPSVWMAAAPKGERLDLLHKLHLEWRSPPATGKAWTDDFTNILSALDFF